MRWFGIVYLKNSIAHIYNSRKLYILGGLGVYGVLSEVFNKRKTTFQGIWGSFPLFN